MTTALDVARQPSAVNALVKTMMEGAAELLARAADGASARELEEGVWELVVSQGGALLGACMATACKAATEADLEARGLEPLDVRLRLDRDYWGTQMSTFGPISFPLFAYRERQGAATVTHTPARRELLPTLGRCRSTTLCLEWEARLGKDLPFRRAADALGFFSHGAVREEDTTLAAHAVAVGSVIDREWLYRPVDEIRRILDERAARDLKTGRPIIYLSQDAHAERRFVDETWSAAWKSMNGLRLWTLDRNTGATIHLGGEYTWGDCNQVGEIVEHLIETDILPRNGDYGGGTVAELVVVTDGLPWIENHVISKLPWAHVILDLYHALEHIGDFAAELCGAGTTAAVSLYRRLAKLLAPEHRSRATAPKARKGHTKGKPSRSQHRLEYGSIWALLDSLYDAGPDLTADGSTEPFEALVGYLENNAYRGDYQLYRSRGFQLGSGAMESLHRTAAQTRLKLAGARWTAKTSLALVSLRLIELAGRWNEFWRNDGLNDLLRSAFVGVGDLST
jgi:hypothetical protein